MNTDDPLDLSALDPTHDGDRWNSTVETTLRRVDAILARRPRDPLSLIASWSRPVTLAAAAAILILVPIEVMLERRQAGAEQIERLAQLSAESIGGLGSPTGEELSRAILEGLQ